MLRLRTRSVFSRRVGGSRERIAGLVVLLVLRVLRMWVSDERGGGFSRVNGSVRRDGWKSFSSICSRYPRVGFDLVYGLVRRDGWVGFSLRAGTARLFS